MSAVVYKIFNAPRQQYVTGPVSVSFKNTLMVGRIGSSLVLDVLFTVYAILRYSLQANPSNGPFKETSVQHLFILFS
jgi:hypothetical protein